MHRSEITIDLGALRVALEATRDAAVLPRRAWDGGPGAVIRSPDPPRRSTVTGISSGFAAVSVKASPGSLLPPAITSAGIVTPAHWALDNARPC
jgi:hypothetical protein